MTKKTVQSNSVISTLTVFDGFFPIFVDEATICDGSFPAFLGKFLQIPNPKQGNFEDFSRQPSFIIASLRYPSF